jgi:hypothetical protein
MLALLLMTGGAAPGIAARIVSERALDTARRRVTVDDEAGRTRYVFRSLVDAAYGLSLERSDSNPALMDEAFRAAQWQERSETSAAMSQMAAGYCFSGSTTSLSA